jgi:hypothetical protein
MVHLAGLPVHQISRRNEMKRCGKQAPESEEGDMRLPRLKAISGFFLAAILSLPAWAGDATTNAAQRNSAQPGTLNYVEGQVSIGDQVINSKSIGSAELESGQLLITEKGKAEILLTPGVFLRVGDNSAVKMISPSITDTEIGVEKGNAMIEVAELHPENDIRVFTGDRSTQLLRTGLYDFNLNQNELRVFEGKAIVEGNGKPEDVKGGHEVSLASNAWSKVEKFDKKDYTEGDLYRWSSLRSAYVAEANVDAAGIYAADGWAPWGYGFWGAGWYWDPWFSAYTFIPGDGVFYSPFGWGFYSPWFVGWSPFYRFGWGYGHFYHTFSTNYHNWGPGHHYVAARNYAHGIYNGPGSTGRGGFHSGARGGTLARGFGSGGFHGGGFHGGGLQGGGFHGGGFSGGGFHGGGGRGR